jgi:futalosine hydrolase
MTFYHLVVAATNIEIKHLYNVHGVNPINTSLLKLSDNIDCIITGIGQYNTIKSVTQHINIYGKPTSIINIGIAGAYNKSDKLSSLVRVVKDIAFDQKVIHKNTIQSWQEAFLPNAKSNIFMPESPSYSEKLTLKKATGLTSDTISDNPDRIAQIIAKYKPTVETMEGAACFYIANEYEIPAIQIRSISNYVGNSDKSQWKIEESIQELNRFVNENLIGKLR